MSKSVVHIPFPISKPFKTPVCSHNYVISYPLINLSSRYIPLFYLFNFLRILNLRISILTRVSLFSKVFFCLSQEFKTFPASLATQKTIYQSKVNNTNTRKRCEIWLKLIIKTRERRQLPLNKFYNFFHCLHCWLWADN